MADDYFIDPGKRWVPLSAYLRRALPPRSSPLRVGQPVGPFRLEALFAERRKRGEIQVRGYPEKVQGEPQLLPRGEWHGYLLHECADRLEHVHSGQTWYVVEVLDEAPEQQTGSVEEAGAQGVELEPRTAEPETSEAETGPVTDKKLREFLIGLGRSILEPEARKKKTREHFGRRMTKKQYWRVRRTMTEEHKRLPGEHR